MGKMTIMKNGLIFIALSIVCGTGGCGSSGGGGDAIDYVALGASDAIGVGAVAPFKGYVFEIRDRLQNECKDVELTNLGIPGAKAGDIQNGASSVAREIDPDLITLWTGTNDLVSGDSVEEFESSLHDILDDIDGGQAEIFIANLPDLTRLPAVANDPDVTEARIRAYNQAIVRQAADVGATVVDLRSVEFTPDLISDDGFHPSNAGHRRIAELFLSAIVPRLCD